MISAAPFRTTPMSGQHIGWLVPFCAALLACVIPSLLAWLIVYYNGATLSGPPKDGSGYRLGDHVAFVSAFVATSVVVTWMMVPLAAMVLRAAAMLGWAGWGSAVIVSWAVGLPAVHIMLNGDLTTDGNGLLAPVMMAIAILALSNWAVFWGLMAWRAPPSP